ncbi:MAG: methyltransferase domain-containing protein [Candidatus Buchananbacteria bacterium]|jgi:ubiquinone/menaquinone biosynthesis C-methylase UbiE
MKRQNVNRILEETPKIYNEIAADFSDTRGKWWEGFGDFAKYVKRGDNVLDLGCGNGRMAQLFDNSGVEYLGLDNSQELIEIAQNRYKNKSDFKFEVADAVDLHLASNQFDLELMIAALHHIPTRALRLKILKDLYQALKPGGRLVISNWNLWNVNGRKYFRYYPYLFNLVEKFNLGVYNISDAFVPWKANLRQSEWHVRYVHSFTKREMKNLLTSAGFSIDYLSYASKSRGSVSILTGDNLLAIAVKK